MMTALEWPKRTFDSTKPTEPPADVHTDAPRSETLKAPSFSAAAARAMVAEKLEQLHTQRERGRHREGTEGRIPPEMMPLTEKDIEAMNMSMRHAIDATELKVELMRFPLRRADGNDSERIRQVNNATLRDDQRFVELMPLKVQGWIAYGKKYLEPNGFRLDISVASTDADGVPDTAAVRISWE